jgi:hypothetical protein
MEYGNGTFPKRSLGHLQERIRLKEIGHYSEKVSLQSWLGSFLSPQNMNNLKKRSE